MAGVRAETGEAPADVHVTTVVQEAFLPGARNRALLTPEQGTGRER